MTIQPVGSITIFTCQRSQREWASRLGRRPIKCPCCQSPDWDRPKRPPLPPRAQPVRQRARYDFPTLEIGQSITLPWLGRELPDHQAHALNARRTSAFDAYARRMGYRVFSAGTPAGLQITRLPNAPSASVGAPGSA